ncbi:sigma-54-dependent Fis family transcriptional regulator [Nakamurella leprariae]|uniref:Sigma-54 factor interaction domain-containing protein n=1 Tax=Nakamurella leprariae TaxID=2803911 RepID=A0A939C1R5_9ACTN|nr:helix-turn-helix domain-containing protein [Nakamurella leprariae]MBM9467439.1 hypothetical protein [Nakamurella leprariae]
MPETSPQADLPDPHAGSGAWARPADLRSSWERSRSALGAPEAVRDVPQVAPELLDANLLEMFQAPLARVSDSLDGTGLGLLLADADGRILQRWTHDRAAAAHLDRVGTQRGAVLTESVVGTNGVGTVAATGRSVQIIGAEHFADFYREAVCTGAPVRHPVTGRLVAVVTMSTVVSERTDLLRPLTRSIVAQLEQHVLDVEQPSARWMLAEFLRTSRQHHGPVVGFGPDGLTVQSQRAGRLTAADIGLLRRVCADTTRSADVVLEFAAGPAAVTLTPLHGGGTLAAVSERPRTSRVAVSPRPPLAGRNPTLLAVATTVARHRDAREPLVVCGERGSGKTSLALGCPYRAPNQHSEAVVDAADRHVRGSRAWLQALAERLRAPSSVVIRGVDSLDEAMLEGMKSLIDGAPGRGSVLMTGSFDDPAAASAFAARLGWSSVWVPPLRERLGDIPALWRALAEQVQPNGPLVADAAAAAAMEKYSWPGNLVELRNVVTQLVLAGRRGTIGVADLPAGLRGGRALSMIERAELQAIQRALQESGGNRSQAAEILGLSRATVYRKMKAYQLTA